MKGIQQCKEYQLGDEDKFTIVPELDYDERHQYERKEYIMSVKDLLRAHKKQTDAWKAKLKKLSWPRSKNSTKLKDLKNARKMHFQERDDEILP